MMQGALQSEREFWLFMKNGLKKLLDAVHSHEEKFAHDEITQVAKYFLELLSNPAKILLAQDPLFIKNLSTDTIMNHCNFTMNDEDKLLLKTWLDNGLFSYASFGPSSTPAVSPTIPEEFKSEYDYKAVLKQLIQSQNIWRLFIGTDRQQEESPLSYQQRQQGALVAMTNALKVALADLDKDLDFDLLLDIHDACVQGVNGVNDIQHANKSSRFRDKDETIGFGISQIGNDSNASQDGYREACLHPGLGTDYQVTPSRISTVLWGESLKVRLSEILLQYNQQINAALSKEAKLKIIVCMLSLIERIHPFWDANCRAICVITLLRELIKHGFHLTMLKNPNRFDCYSSNELMQDVIDGFYHCKRILAHGALENEPQCIGNEKQECNELLITLESIAQSLFLDDNNRKMKVF